MKPPSGTAAVRLTLWTLVMATFAMALVQPADAGTEEAPEIADPANDQAVLGESVSAAGFAAADVLFGWIDNEDATALQLNIRTSGDILGGNAQGEPTTYYRFIFHLTAGGTEYTAEADVHFEAVAEPGGAATAAVVEGSLLKLTVPKANIGNPAPGAVLSNLFIDAEVHVPPVPADPVTDRAPDEGAGTDYAVTGGGAGGGNQTCPNCTAEDIDGDGLNNTCEEEHFGSANSTANATGDPDGDGLTNGQECALGTDPNDSDSDDDGVPDNQDPFPTDPARGGTSTGTSTSGSRTTTTSRSSTTGGGTTSGDGDGSVTDLDSAIKKLESNVSYLGMSAGGFLAVLVLCIIGLAVRWSL